LVYALKSYHNNQPYKREEDSNVLDVLIKKFSKEEHVQYEKKSFVDKSVQKLATNSIIEGYFPKENVVKQMAIKRVNKMLCVIISMLITVVIVSYYFVISCEMKLNDLSRQTVILNNENSDLQNQLDSLKSFNNVDKTLQQNNMLQRAGQVIETDEVTVDSTMGSKQSVSKKIFRTALGF
jgi:cell division protein FtsL